MCWSCKSNTHINYSRSPLIQLEFCWWLVYRAQLSRQAFEGSHLLSIRNTTEAERRANKDRQIFRALNLCLGILLNVYMQQMSLSAVKHAALCSSSSFPFSNKRLKSYNREARLKYRISFYRISFWRGFTAIVKSLKIKKHRRGLAVLLKQVNIDTQLLLWWWEWLSMAALQYKKHCQVRYIRNLLWLQACSFHQPFNWTADDGLDNICLKCIVAPSWERFQGRWRKGSKSTMTLCSGRVLIKAVEKHLIIMIRLYLTKSCKVNRYKVADLWTVLYKLLFKMTLRPEVSNLANLQLVLRKGFTAGLGTAGECVWFLYWKNWKKPKYKDSNIDEWVWHSGKHSVWLLQNEVMLWKCIRIPYRCPWLYGWTRSCGCSVLGLSECFWWSLTKDSQRS